VANAQVCWQLEYKMLFGPLLLSSFEKDISMKKKIKRNAIKFGIFWKPNIYVCRYRYLTTHFSKVLHPQYTLQLNISFTRDAIWKKLNQRHLFLKW
jgi:hypothetical protein